MRVYADLHIHTLLTPCADDDMTPCNITAMAKLKGLTAIAVTDHNTARNARAVVEAGAEAGILVIPGLELQTSEDIHVVCLFPDAESAEAFSGLVYSRMMKIPNKTVVYGCQTVVDKNDTPRGEIAELLLVAADISVSNVVALAGSCGGIAYPAHIDREENGILAILGGIDPSLGFFAAEVSENADTDLIVIKSSDAHYLGDIAEREFYIDCDFPEESLLDPARRRENIEILFAAVRQGKVGREKLALE